MGVCVCVCIFICSSRSEIVLVHIRASSPMFTAELFVTNIFFTASAFERIDAIATGFFGVSFNVCSSVDYTPL